MWTRYRIQSELPRDIAESAGARIGALGLHGPPNVCLCAHKPERKMGLKDNSGLGIS